MTSKYRKWFVILFIISLLLNVAPLTIYTITAFIQCDVVVEKITLSMTLFMVLILSIVSWSNKLVLRSKLWIILIGLYFTLDYILTPLIVIAVCQVLDELLVSPLKNSYHNKLVIHKELDKRLTTP